MTAREVKDIAASVRQRLLKKARADNIQFDELLRYYVIERFLYRLSKSRYSEKFILKGALMLAIWESPATRPTSDIDVLGQTENNIEGLETVFREVCDQPVKPDGLVFDAEAVSGEIITEQVAYPGVRIGMIGRLGQARATFHIDVGFGDFVIPTPVQTEYPVILDMPPPRLLTYSKESSIAEKAETMVRFGLVNSRMKDFYDMWLLSRTTSFEGDVFSKALSGTFETRGTSLPDDISDFMSSVAAEVGKQSQWRSFLDRSKLTNTHAMFSEIVDDLNTFLEPPLRAILRGSLFNSSWEKGGPWKEMSQ